MALNTPPPSRIAIGYVSVAGQRLEVLMNTEWARYFESLNSEVVATAGAAGAPGAAGAQGPAGVALMLDEDSASPMDFVPGVRGETGPQGAPGPALFMLQEQSSDDALFVPPVCIIGTRGTQTNDDAQAGSVGELVSATFTAVAMGASVINVSSFSLTAGDWDVSGGVVFSGSATNITQVAAGASLTSATLGSPGTYMQLAVTTSVAGGAIPTVRVSIAATTTVYLVGLTSFASGTARADGIFRARRVR